MKNNVFQIMRGVCIIAVILTHINIINPNYEAALFIQNIVNIAVTGFIFLAGYFVNIDDAKNNSIHFVIRKSQRILAPYFLWSIFYMLYNIILRNENYTLYSLAKAFLSGKGIAYHLYYCVLYFLFLLIIPFVVKRMENKIWNIVFYSIMPAWIIVIYYLQINFQISYSTWGIIPFSWFLYFYAGLKWRNIAIKLNIFTIAFLICFGYLIESVETYYLLSATNNINFSVTPRRFSTILYVLPIILLFLKLGKIDRVEKNIFISLGNNSFGIYLSHIFVLECVRFAVNKIIYVQYNAIHYIFYVMIILTITLFVTNMLVNVCRKFMPAKFLKWIGFSK